MEEYMGTVTKGKGAIYIKTLIGIAFMYFFGLVCPTFGGMSQMGIKILGVFIGLIFMTCVGCDLFSSSLLALLAFVLQGKRIDQRLDRLRSDLSAYFCRGALRVFKADRCHGCFRKEASFA